MSPSIVVAPPRPPKDHLQHLQHSASWTQVLLNLLWRGASWTQVVLNLLWRQQVHTDTQHLNSFNSLSTLADETDVLVVGGGIHSLIYAIHARKWLPATRSITVVEKELTPSYKIGESTLSSFGLWLKTIGIDSALLWRLFGPKDGLAFYYLPGEGDPEGYTSFCANGPPGDFITTLQMERKISELLLTLVAQRLGVNVWHGHGVDINTSVLKDGGSIIPTSNLETKEKKDVKAKLVVDATGRFRRFASKEATVKRFDGWNTDAFWAYFEECTDESEVPLRHYETVYTNHICVAEGWAWVIRLPSWEGSSIWNLTRMINHLLDLNFAKTPADKFPSVRQLVKMFDLKFRWVVSIGFALRSDVEYPADLSSYGTCEAEKRFWWIVNKYPKMSALMANHKLIHDLYGPSSTWVIRKNLTYVSPKVSGDGFVAIGDAVGFTNPLYSPGINSNMGTSVTAAELTNAYLTASHRDARTKVLSEYEGYCAGRIEVLHRMNKFNYVLMRTPKLGRVGPQWQYLVGIRNWRWQKLKSFNFGDVSDVLKVWDWGSHEPAYINFANQVIEMLPGAPHEPVDEEMERQILELSQVEIKEALATGKYHNRWAGMLLWYDDELQLIPTKTQKDVFARRCSECSSWRLLTGSLRCPIYGTENDPASSIIEWLQPEHLVQSQFQSQSQF